MNADLIIRGGTVIDGTGGPSFAADVALAGGRIVAVGDLDDWTASAIISAVDRVVSPGFIDTHAHDDRALIETPLMECKVSQGVTTVIAGNCGISAAPFVPGEAMPDPISLLGSTADFHPDVATYRQAIEDAQPAINVGLLVGHGVLRVEVLGVDYQRAATPVEIDRMGGRLAEALDQGAIGLSSGLQYPTSRGSTTDEVAELARHIGGVPGALYASHIRDEGDHQLEALEEAFTIGRRSELPVVISHHKCAGTQNHGRSVETLAAIEQAASGHPINIDVYPYTAGSTVLSAEHARSATHVLIAESGPYPELAGHTLTEVAEGWGTDEATALERLRPGAGIYEMMAEPDLERILSYPGAMIGSDGLPGTAHPHPRLWGTFPRVLGRYTREVGLLTLVDAIHRMTGLPATTFGLNDRGFVRQGMAADLVIFDPATIADTATYAEPQTTAVGIDHVIVNGRRVWSEGASTGAKPGQFLARAGSS